VRLPWSLAARRKEAHKQKEKSVSSPVHSNSRLKRSAQPAAEDALGGATRSARANDLRTDRVDDGTREKQAREDHRLHLPPPEEVCIHAHGAAPTGKRTVVRTSTRSFCQTPTHEYVVPKSVARKRGSKGRRSASGVRPHTSTRSVRNTAVHATHRCRWQVLRPPCVLSLCTRSSKRLEVESSC